MEIHTYTNIWSTSKRLYTIGDISLPQPVPLVSAAIFILTLIVWAPLMFTLGVPVSSGVGIAAYLSAPVGLAWVGNKPIFQNKSIIQYVMGYVTYLKEPKIWTALRDDKDMREEKIALSAKAWVPDKATKEQQPKELIK